MSKFIDNGRKHTGAGPFLQRYAQLIKEKQDSNVSNVTEEFQTGYRKGSMRFTLASSHMKLISAGLDKFLEDKDGVAIIWERQGDQIVRTDSDTSWIDKLLEDDK